MERDGAGAGRRRAGTGRKRWRDRRQETGPWYRNIILKTKKRKYRITQKLTSSNEERRNKNSIRNVLMAAGGVMTKQTT